MPVKKTDLFSVIVRQSDLNDDPEFDGRKRVVTFRALKLRRYSLT